MLYQSVILGNLQKLRAAAQDHLESALIIPPYAALLPDARTAKM